MTMKKDESDADYCRRMGWGPGTVLEGTKSGTDTCGKSWSVTDRIEITAVGKQSILAITLSPTYFSGEHWTLSTREWRQV